ncbi:hypothetical protein [Amycolatopsis vancoresmycina]|uniref:Secreted protein n=1 Tax=Amycolatopsis vancoresmycina DSM 44592 TaxID=1292037 RepID=R1I8C7_9PSEU|nr:hypothetical protein [Amycolatopsis vancoresmycina]EOD66679.1 hypothetical protein H480_20304 [Amycolatopsis vancoresmycina DSM 44592]
MSRYRFGTAVVAVAAASVAALSGVGAASAATTTTTATPATVASGHCPPENVEVDFSNGTWWCFESHANHRYHVNRCDVTELDTGANWVAIWAGPNQANLGYYSRSPYQRFSLGSTFCIGDFHINP